MKHGENCKITSGEIDEAPPPQAHSKNKPMAVAGCKGALQ
jgi:hypothetical protein